ncbi:hypothetical protein HY628_02715 [Candidatus Uhrbacteria bacterium]|nr:hypothetical protein [Candidatus Uhrbacteria bacterium]
MLMLKPLVPLREKAVNWWRKAQGIEVTRIPYADVPEVLRKKVIGVDKNDPLASMAFPVGKTIDDVKEIRKFRTGTQAAVPIMYCGMDAISQLFGGPGLGPFYLLAPLTYAGMPGAIHAVSYKHTMERFADSVETHSKEWKKMGFVPGNHTHVSIGANGDVFLIRETEKNGLRKFLAKFPKTRRVPLKNPLGALTSDLVSAIGTNLAAIKKIKLTSVGTDGPNQTPGLRIDLVHHPTTIDDFMTQDGVVGKLTYFALEHGKTMADHGIGIGVHMAGEKDGRQILPTVSIDLRADGRILRTIQEKLSTLQKQN